MPIIQRCNKNLILSGLLFLLIAFTVFSSKKLFLTDEPDTQILSVEEEISLPVKLSERQVEVLKLAYSLSSSLSWGDSTEYSFPETVQAIVLQESSAGEGSPVGDIHRAVGKRSYGLMQVKTIAAIDVFDIVPDLKPKTRRDGLVEEASWL